MCHRLLPEPLGQYWEWLFEEQIYSKHPMSTLLKTYILDLFTCTMHKIIPLLPLCPWKGSSDSSFFPCASDQLQKVQTSSVLFSQLCRCLAHHSFPVRTELQISGGYCTNSTAVEGAKERKGITFSLGKIRCGESWGVCLAWPRSSSRTHGSNQPLGDAEVV